MIDLKLDPVTGDLDISDNQLSTTTEGVPSVAQRLRIRLRFFYQEWVLDRSKGTKWFELILRKDVDKFAADQEIRKQILETDGVATIESWESDLDTRTRKYTTQFTVRTEDRELVTFGFSDPVV